MKLPSIAILASTLILPTAIRASNPRTHCPGEVVSAIEKELPAAKILSCRIQRADGGGSVYRARGVTSDEDVNARLYFNRAGDVIFAEREVPNDSLPAMVLAAFDTRFRNDEIDAAEKQVDSAGNVTWHVGFRHRHGPLAATFAPDGRLVDEMKVSRADARRWDEED